ncbi:MAG: ATP-binding protein, partial [Pseudomonadota bacterium]
TLTGNGGISGPADPPARGVTRLETVTHQGDAVRVASVTRVVLASPSAVPVTVSVGQTRNGVSQITRELSRQAALLSVVFFILAVVLSAIVARTSLRQLTDIADAVARRGPSDLRPLRQTPPEELAPLMTSLNRLIERLARSLRQSEDFIAEAAHRIRTPLATVRAQAEIALRNARDPGQAQHMRQIIRAVDESSRSATQLLDHATVAFRAEQLADAELDLAQIAQAATASLQPTADLKDIDIHLVATPAPVRGDKLLLDSALRNVLDNAVKYSPPETQVSVVVDQAETRARITVTDRGPGLGDTPADVYTARFQRGTNSAGTVGSGLGLTIARDVVEAHGGTLELSNHKGGGTCVLLNLPLA